MSYIKGELKYTGSEFTPDGQSILNEHDVYIAECYGSGELSNQATEEEAEANAKRIVQCWNNFDNLVKACKAIIEGHGFNEGNLDDELEYMEISTKSLIALQQAINKTKE